MLNNKKVRIWTAAYACTSESRYKKIDFLSNHLRESIKCGKYSFYNINILHSSHLCVGKTSAAILNTF